MLTASRRLFSFWFREDSPISLGLEVLNETVLSFHKTHLHCAKLNIWDCSTTQSSQSLYLILECSQNCYNYILLNIPLIFFIVNEFFCVTQNKRNDHVVIYVLNKNSYEATEAQCDLVTASFDSTMACTVCNIINQETLWSFKARVMYGTIIMSALRTASILGSVQHSLTQ